MNEELNRNNSNVKILTTLVIIFIILVLSLGGYLIYDKIINKEEKKNNVNNEVPENNQECVVDKVVSYVEENNGVPYITLDNLDSVNEKIKEYYSSSNSTYSYEYSVKNNILFIFLSKITPVAMDANVENEGIYIDLNNKKELTISEVIQLLNINNDDLNKGLNGIALDRAIIMPSLSLCVVEGKGIAEIDRFYIGC